MTLTQAPGAFLRPTSSRLGAWVSSLAFPRLFSFFAFLMLTDWLVTVVALSMGAVEGNPAMAPLFDANPLVPLVLKLAGLLFIGWAVSVVKQTWPLGAQVTLAFCCIAMSAVVAWNLTVLWGLAA